MVRDVIKDRDFTASAYIKKENKILLLNHDKLDKWLPPGGHIEEKETPEEAAKREALEETGYVIEIKDPFNEVKQIDETENLPKPVNINLHSIDNGHYHCDFAYLGSIVSKSTASHEDEHNGLKWFDKDELRSSELEIPENVLEVALKIID